MDSALLILLLVFMVGFMVILFQQLLIVLWHSKTCTKGTLTTAIVISLLLMSVATVTISIVVQAL